MKIPRLLFLVLILSLCVFTACGKDKGPILQGIPQDNIPSQHPDEENGQNSGNQKPPIDPPPATPDPNAGITLGKNALTLQVNETAILEIRFIPAYAEDDTTLVFTISDKEVISVDRAGKITALAEGSATLTVSCGDFSASCVITVEKEKNENPGISLKEDAIELRNGKSKQIEAVLVPNNKGDATTLTFVSDAPSIVSVDKNGLLTAHAVGSATITLSGGGFEKTLKVTVPNSFTFLAAGDNLLHAGVYSDAKVMAGGKGYNFLPIYRAIADKVADADFSMINQETVFTGASPSSYPSLNAPQEAVKALADLGFDIISLANNHCLDKGGSGLAKSMNYLDSLKTVIRLGGYFKKNNDALTIRVIEKDGIKVALLAYTTFTNGDIPSDYNSSGVYVPWAVEENMIDDIARAKTKADAVLVFMHWGDEEQFDVTEKQKKMAQLLADNGADIIIGAHPHVIQPVEIITAANGKEVPCVYSLGTLVSNMATEQNMLSCLVTFDFVKDPESGKVHVENLEMDPYVFYYDMEYRNSALYRITDFTDSLAKSHGVGNYPKDSATKNTVSIQRLYGYLKKYIDADYLPEDVKKELT